MTHRVFWMASLSNGETLYEGKGSYKREAQQLAPWVRLKEHCLKDGLNITSLALYTDAGQVWNLPSSGKNPKLKAFQDPNIPIKYYFKRRAAQDLDFSGKPMGQMEGWSIIGADYGSLAIEVWVSNDDPRKTWINTEFFDFE